MKEEIKVEEKKQEKQAKASKALFWLIVPAGVCFFLGFISNKFVPALDPLAITALLYSLFSLWVFSRSDKPFVRIPLLIFNGALVEVAAYYEFIHLKPETWPQWTTYGVLGLVFVLWVLAIRGAASMSTHEDDGGTASQPTAVPAGETSQVPAGSHTASLNETLNAYIKLAGGGGEFTANVGRLLENLANIARTDHINALAAARNSRVAEATLIADQINRGVIPTDKVPMSLKHFFKLLRMDEEEATPEETQLTDQVLEGAVASGRRRRVRKADRPVIYDM